MPMTWSLGWASSRRAQTHMGFFAREADGTPVQDTCGDCGGSDEAPMFRGCQKVRLKIWDQILEGWFLLPANANTNPKFEESA